MDILLHLILPVSDYRRHTMEDYPQMSSIGLAFFIITAYLLRGPQHQLIILPHQVLINRHYMVNRM